MNSRRAHASNPKRHPTPRPPEPSREAEESLSVMTPDEKIDEASRESMVASDPPARPVIVGAPKHSSSTEQPAPERIAERAHELWEADGRPSGGEHAYHVRAETELRTEAAAKPKN
jgi:hypothetical protein